MVNRDDLTPPFNLIDITGSDWLVFVNKFVESAALAPEKLAERGEEIYRKRAVYPMNKEESKSQITITGEHSFDVEIVIAQPKYSLVQARDARNEFSGVTPGTLTEVLVQSTNVGVSGRNRPVLGKDLWMLFSTLKIIDIAQKEEAKLESDLRTATNEEFELKQVGSNVALKLNTSEMVMHNMIEFGADIGDIIGDRFDTRVGDVQIAAGNNFDFMF